MKRLFGRGKKEEPVGEVESVSDISIASSGLDSVESERSSGVRFVGLLRTMANLLVDIEAGIGYTAQEWGEICDMLQYRADEVLCARCGQTARAG